MAVNPETISFVLSDDEINFWAEKLEEKDIDEIIDIAQKICPWKKNKK